MGSLEFLPENLVEGDGMVSYAIVSGCDGFIWNGGSLIGPMSRPIDESVKVIIDVADARELLLAIRPQQS